MRAHVCHLTKRRHYSTRNLEQQVRDLEKQLFAEREVYPALLQRCGRERCLDLAKRIHTHLSRSGFRNDVFLSNLLVQTYTRCSSLCEARKTFDSNPNKNAHSWNIMIVGHLQNSNSDSAFALYEQMWLLGVHYIHRPVLVVRSISSLESLRVLHKRVVCEISNDPITCAAFVRKYGGFGCLQEAKNAFNTLSTGKRDTICWTALISVYAQNMHGREAIEIFKEMDTPPDLIAFVTAIDACSTIRDAQHGIWLHNRASQEGFKSHILATSLVTLYGRCGLVAFAKSVFDQHQGFPMDIVSWSAMIAAFAQNGHHLEAVEMLESTSLCTKCSE